jgi:hypothetical protein
VPSGWFRRGQAGGLLPGAVDAGSGQAAAPGLGGNGGTAGLFVERASGERANGGQSTAGLPVRVPKGARAPGGSPDGPGAVGLPGRAPGGPAAGANGNPLPQRSPDQARSRLSGFQRGTRRADGQVGGGKSPQPEEGTER